MPEDFFWLKKIFPFIFHYVRNRSRTEAENPGNSGPVIISFLCFLLVQVRTKQYQIMIFEFRKNAPNKTTMKVHGDQPSCIFFILAICGRKNERLETGRTVFYPPYQAITLAAALKITILEQDFSTYRE